MFNSTHTLVAVAIARTGADEWVPYAAATAVIASNLPDIEIVSGLLRVLCAGSGSRNDQNEQGQKGTGIHLSLQ